MKPKILILTSLTLLLAFATWFYYGKIPTEQKPKKRQLPASFKLGNVNQCRKIPEFVADLSMQQPAIDSKQQGHSGGLLIRDIGQSGRVWQHPSWTQSGYIGGFDRDHLGNIYVLPLPYVSLSKNPPAKQNRIYKIDGKTAQMSLFMELPYQTTPSEKNPFGTMALFFDCDTRSLYVSSVAGSSATKQQGVIYQIDVKQKKIVSKYPNIDAVGLGVFNTLKGKKLYFGLARKPHIYSVYLDEQGRFASKKYYEFSLSQIQGGDSTVVKKIQFKKAAQKFIMLVKEMEFGFRLLAETNPYRKKYSFQYQLSQDQWQFLYSSQD